MTAATLQVMAPSSKRVTFGGKHVLITGGSEGTGLAIAKQVAAEGARVTLVARTLSKLEAARSEVQACYAPGQLDSQVLVCPADVTNNSQVVEAVKTAEAMHGPVDVLVACAGAATLGYFHELEVTAFEQQMSLNYMGCVHAAKAVISGMVARNSGHVCFISSTLGLIGFVGWTAYCPSKYAVRGLAECLRNELQGTNVTVSIAFPPDIDTPGLARENLQKPPECYKISEGKVYSADKVAQSIVRGIKAGHFFLPNADAQVGMVQTLAVTTGPRRLLSSAWEALLGSVRPIVWGFVTMDTDGVAAKGAKQRYARLWGAAAGDGAGGAVGGGSVTAGGKQ